MAKACAYLCRQCCFIDGFSEFGEFGEHSFAEVAHFLSCKKLNVTPRWPLATVQCILVTSQCTLVYHKRLTIAHGKYHTDQSRAHAYIY